MQAKKMSQLQKIIKQPKGNTGTTSYSPKSDDEQAFVDKHEIQFTDDANGNGDDVFKGMIVKKISRASSRHGYDSPKDQSVNESLTDEELNQLIEMSAKMKKKRHEISLALKRENPDWSMDKVFAIATSAAQKAVNEEYDIIDEDYQIDEVTTPYLKKYLERSDSQLTKHFNKDDNYNLSRSDVKKRLKGRDLAIKKVYGANPYDDNDKEPKVRSTKPKVIIHGFKEENSESEKGEYLKGVRKRVAQRRSELYKDYADKDEKSGKSSGSVYQKMAKRQAELAKEEAEIEEGNNTQKKFTVVHYSPKTDRNVTKKIKANSESEVWDRLKAKGINPVSVKEELDLDEKVKTTHEDPLVTVHDKDGLHTHANLSVANNIFGTKVKHTDVHAGKTKTKSRDGGDLTFAISKHHAAALKEELDCNDIDVSILELYLDLDDYNKDILIEMLDNGLDELITEFIAENKNA